MSARNHEFRDGQLLSAIMFLHVRCMMMTMMMMMYYVNTRPLNRVGDTLI